MTLSTAELNAGTTDQLLISPDVWNAFALALDRWMQRRATVIEKLHSIVNRSTLK